MKILQHVYIQINYLFIFRRMLYATVPKTRTVPRYDKKDIGCLKIIDEITIESICRVVMMTVKTIGPNSLIV